jgi:hypothetical protein
LFFVVGWDGGEEAANQGQTIFRYFAGRPRHQRREFTTSSIIINHLSEAYYHFC